MGLLELLLLAEKTKTQVLPLFAKTSLKYAETGKISDAKNFFFGNYVIEGDIKNPYMTDFFSPDIFDDPEFLTEFQRLAAIVYAPWCKKD